ncbi:prolyl oligopeptidase family serine peptidase [Psychrobacillus antarcticus]|uniref:prolyl oligopeptidase family serine peptidase n=1 Tax=Psychrobacillus antarcticus TaxID=2879115 RepID=UPI002407CA25|nr:prolyl oligopeptidase family serine peptidase [Psychrobacillus antarcticus]
MIVTTEAWGNIPLLHIHKEETKKDAPIVIFLHGFESGKEHNLHYAYQLAQQGCRIILPDAHLHGERDEKLDQVEISLRFWEIILTSIEEVGLIKHELEKQGYLSDQKIGLAGTSMGGITTLGCLTVYPWIEAAAILMGTPGYVELAKAQIASVEQKGFKVPLNEEERKNMFYTLSKFDASNHPDNLVETPLFFWHGEKDPVVPYEPTAQFIATLRKQHNNKNIVLMNEKSAGHAVSRKGLLASMEWLANRLA